MTIVIPTLWIQIVCNVLFWACSSALLACLIIFALIRITMVLRRRHDFWAAAAFLTTKNQKAKANEYTLGQFRTLAMALREENPAFLKNIQEVFSDNLGDYPMTPCDI